MARGLAEPVPATGRWSDLRIRVLSAAVLLPLTLGCAWVGGVAYILLLSAAALGLAAEWVRLRRGGSGPVDQPRAGTAGQSTSSGFSSGTLAAPAGPSRVVTCAGFVYIALAMISLLWLRSDKLAGRTNLLVLLLLVWASDVGAYATGRAIGGPRLAPRISPGKTVSGAAGGLIAAVAVGLGADLVLSHPVQLLRAGLLAACLGVIAQAGDLFESWMKRRLGVKDSGTLIPGHGGLFDRLDALLAAAPAAALLALWAGRGVAWWQ